MKYLEIGVKYPDSDMSPDNPKKHPILPIPDNEYILVLSLDKILHYMSLCASSV